MYSHSQDLSWLKWDLHFRAALDWNTVTMLNSNIYFTAGYATNHSITLRKRVIPAGVAEEAASDSRGEALCGDVPFVCLKGRIINGPVFWGMALTSHSGTCINHRLALFSASLLVTFVSPTPNRSTEAVHLLSNVSPHLVPAVTWQSTHPLTAPVCGGNHSEEKCTHSRKWSFGKRLFVFRLRRIRNSKSLEMQYVLKTKKFLNISKKL